MTAVDERAEVRDELVVARAVSELTSRRRVAATVAAADSGRPQREIAEALGVSQPAVAQLLARARRSPGSWQRTVWQVALEYAAGELSREQMRKEFVAWPWTFARFADGDSPLPEAYVAGSWDELSFAVSQGLVDDDDYAYIYDRLPERK